MSKVLVSIADTHKSGVIETGLLWVTVGQWARCSSMHTVLKHAYMEKEEIMLCCFIIIFQIQVCSLPHEKKKPSLSYLNVNNLVSLHQAIILCCILHTFTSNILAIA